MSEFNSNITFGKQPFDWTTASRATVETEWLNILSNMDSEAEHCCDCTPSLCPEFLHPRLCDSCEKWLYS